MSATYCGACRSTVRGEQEACKGCGAPRPSPGWPTDPMIGRLVDGKYRVEKRLSAGGFGTVFIAKQLHGETELGVVVLKFLHAELAHDQRIVKRFVTEARSARELTSPHVVRVFDLGMLEDGVPFMVQEFVSGEGLDAILHKENVLAVDRVLRMGMQVAEAMAEAHAKGILHRDLKPENLRVQQTIQGDFVKVLDFGIARVEHGTGTATNSFIGTPRYMAPEQIMQKGVDARADVFALGVILFELLAGQPPIPAESDMEYIHLNLLTPPRDIRTLRPGIPEELAALVMGMIAKDKNDRPAGMPAVYEILDSIPPVGDGQVQRGSVVARRPGPTPMLATRATPLGAAGMTPPPSGTKRTRPEVTEVPTVTKLPARRILVYGGAAVVAALAIVVVGFSMTRGSGAEPTTQTDAATAIPTPVTAAPLTAAPVTAAPVTAIAATTAPETAAPETAAPDTAAPDRVRRRRGGGGESVAGVGTPPPATSAPAVVQPPPQTSEPPAARVQKLDD